jgi:hypothetical protein
VTLVALAAGGLCWWVLQEPAPTPALTQAPISPSPVAPSPQAAHRAVGPPTVVAATVKGTVWQVVVKQGDPSLAFDLAVRAEGSCAGSEGPVVLHLKTDGEGRLMTPADDCFLHFVAEREDLHLGPPDDDELPLSLAGHAPVRVTDPQGQPIGGAVVTPALASSGGGGVTMLGKPPPDAARSCTTDGTGRCHLAWPLGERLQLTVEARGFAARSFDTDFDGSAEDIVLQRARRVRVTVQAPGPLLVPLRLRLEEAPGGSAGELAQTVDAPGTYEVEGVSRLPWEVTLSELQVAAKYPARPLARAPLAAGTDDATITFPPVVPRRLEVFSELPAHHSGYLSFIDVRCPGAPRMIAELVDAPDGQRQFARLEYAPEGPCVVARASTDLSMTVDPDFEPVTASPPTSVTLHRRREHGE